MGARLRGPGGVEATGPTPQGCSLWRSTRSGVSCCNHGPILGSGCLTAGDGAHPPGVTRALGTGASRTRLAGLLLAPPQRHASPGWQRRPLAEGSDRSAIAASSCYRRPTNDIQLEHPERVTRKVGPPGSMPPERVTAWSLLLTACERPRPKSAVNPPFSSSRRSSLAYGGARRPGGPDTPLVEIRIEDGPDCSTSERL